MSPISTDDVSPSYIENEQQNNSRMKEFKILSMYEVSVLIRKTANKSCELDQFATYILKENVEVFCPIIREINTSLHCGEFPGNLRSALLCPLLKKAGLPLLFKNYRPVLNLSLLSKLIEWAACGQIILHVVSTGKLEPLQSPYWAIHSTEIALLKVKTDIMKARDYQGFMCYMVFVLHLTL